MIAFGLYGAGKISVFSKQSPDRPRVTVAVQGSDKGQVLQVRMQVGRRGENATAPIILRLAARSSSTAPESIDEVDELAMFSLRADVSGNVDETQSIPVDLSAYQWVSVRVCEKSDACGPVNEVARLAGDRLLSPPKVEAHLDPQPGGAKAQFAAAQIPQGAFLQLRVLRIRGAGPESVIATGQFRGDDHGNSAWSPAVEGMKPGDRLIAKSALCRDGKGLNACYQEVQLADYSVLA
jgi:hypothetical protein